MTERRQPRSDSERYPSRRLSSIGGITTGWRSSLESRPHQTIGSFFVEALIAGVFFIGVVILLIVLSSLFAG